jgi:hypothetical protein
MAKNFPDDKFMELIADAIEPEETPTAPSCLKAKVYSALMLRQAETGPLMSLTEVKAGGNALCVFEELVRIAGAGESVEALNICRVCHARVLAEHLEHPPIYWHGCPYVQLKKC